MQLIELGAQKELGILRCHEAPNQQQPADYIWQRQRFHESTYGCFVGRLREDPARGPDWPFGRGWGRMFRGECSHHRKLESAADGLKRDHHASAYSRTPHASQTSICPLPAMMLRR